MFNTVQASCKRVALLYLRPKTRMKIVQKEWFVSWLTCCIQCGCTYFTRVKQLVAWHGRVRPALKCEAHSRGHRSVHDCCKLSSQSNQYLMAAAAAAKGASYAHYAEGMTPLCIVDNSGALLVSTITSAHAFVLCWLCAALGRSMLTLQGIQTAACC